MSFGNSTSIATAWPGVRVVMTSEWNNGFNLGSTATFFFADEADMNAYREAPLHREFVGFCHPYTDDFSIVYYQAPAA